MMALRRRLHRREALLGSSYSGFHCLSKEVFYEFAEKLVSDVDRCFDPPKKVRKRGSMLQGRREAMWSSSMLIVPVYICIQIGVTCLPFYFIPLFLFSELMDKDEVLDVGEKIKKLYMNHKNRRCSRQCI